MVKTKRQKVLGPNSYVCRSYRGKTGRERFCPPILNRVKTLVKFSVFHEDGGFQNKILCSISLFKIFSHVILGKKQNLEQTKNIITDGMC